MVQKRNGEEVHVIAFLTMLLKKFVFASLYRGATQEDLVALDENTAKHVRVLLRAPLVVPGTILSIYFGGDVAAQIVLYVSFAGNVAGLAWFYVTLAALPARHSQAGVTITQRMFTAFVGSIFSMTVLAALTAPWALAVTSPIYLWLYQAAAEYDSADMLKAGKDEEEIKAAKATQRIEDLLRQVVEKGVGK